MMFLRLTPDKGRFFKKRPKVETHSRDLPLLSVFAVLIIYKPWQCKEKRQNPLTFVKTAFKMYG